MNILLDFDQTCIDENWTDIGAEPILKRLIQNGHNLILFTMRSNGLKSYRNFGVWGGLDQAVQWFVDRGIELYGIQKNPKQSSWTSSPKAHGQLIIDDTCLGIPLSYPVDGRPFVDWQKTELLLIEKGIL